MLETNPDLAKNMTIHQGLGNPLHIMLKNIETVIDMTLQSTNLLVSWMPS